MKKKSDHPPFCFVLIPAAKKFLNLWDAAIKPAIEQNGMAAFRGGGDITPGGAFMGGLRDHIVNANMIIAVITDENSNVMYELGLAHAEKKKVIMMLEKGRQPPYELSHSRLFLYDPEDLPSVKEELSKWVPSPGQMREFEDVFPEPHIRSREDVEEYLKQIDKHVIDGDSDFDSLRNHPEYKDRFDKIVKKFHEIASASEPPLIAKASPDVKQTPTARPLPHTLKQFQIKNFQCIARTGMDEIPVDCPWIFITGENGDGKTSLLQAMAIGLHGTANAAHILDGIDKDSKIDTETQQNGASCVRHFYWDQDHWKMVNPTKQDENEKPSRHVFAYGPSRMDINAEDTRTEELDGVGPVYNLLRQKGNLRNIERWLKDEKHEAEIKNGDEKFNIKRRMAKVRALLVTLMPHVSDIEIEGKSVFYTEKGHRVPWQHLSAGHKSIIAMIGDLMIRLFEAQPDRFDPKELEGIVLIDELDAHLHPKWQMKFPGLLSTAFPNAQFIASTHSVIPLMGAPEGSIFLRASRDTINGTRVEKIDIDMANLLPNSILTSPLFGLESILSAQNKDFSELRTEDSFKEIKRQQERDGRLEQHAKKGRQFPEKFFDAGDDGS